MKIVALTTVSGPYIVAKWSVFTTSFPEFSVYLIEFGRTSKTYGWKQVEKVVPYQRIILSDRPYELQSPFKLSFLVIQELKRLRPDVVIINGYAQLTMITAMLWSAYHQKASIIFSDSKEDDAPRSWSREFFKRCLLKGFNAALVAGKTHKNYFIKLGMNSKAIFLGYDVVGNNVFHPNFIKCLPRLLNTSYFLSINRFVPKKNIFLLLSAYASYRQQSKTPAWDLVLCGDGQLREKIEQHIINLNLQNVVHLPGFLQQDELLPYFAHAGCFIHASIQEQWGLVVNEAMAAGLPVLVSDRCGCFEDLVIEGVNGFGFDPQDPQQLTNLMIKISSGQVDLEKMGQASLQHIQNFSPDYFAQGLIQAIKYALASQ